LFECDISDFLIAIAEIKAHIFNDSGASLVGDSEQGEDGGGECAFHAPPSLLQVGQHFTACLCVRVPARLFSRFDVGTRYPAH